MRVGARVRVPFRGRVVEGLVASLRDACDLENVRDVAAAGTRDDVLPDDLLSLGRFVARYYGCATGEALAAMFPKGVRSRAPSRPPLRARLLRSAEEARAAADPMRGVANAKARALRLLAEAPGGALALREMRRRAKVTGPPLRALAQEGWLALEPEPPSRPEVLRAAEEPLEPAAPPPALTPSQEAAVAAVSATVAAGGYAAYLLLGVTGSGKTEVYLRAIAAAVAAGRQAIVLVPEIALTPQTVRRFRERFARVALLHSALGDAERARAWRAARAGEADVVIGPRSAVFAPVPRLGLVVVDEEHETSYKQQTAPRYHARDVALVRARDAGAAVVLGSATPSLESWRNAVEGRFRLLRLPERPGGRPLPPVRLVDLRRDGERRARGTVLSRTLANALGEALGAGGQAILFLNRRGFATSLACPRCGFVAHCPDCDVSLTWHRAGGLAVCHHCGHEAAAPSVCPDCAFPAIRRQGAGTQSVEDEVRSLFPNAVVARMDSDAMATAADYEATLGRFARGEVDVLVGTQMIAKGLHFPRVRLAAVVDADAALSMPDFRAAERTFALVEQVAGRAGRGDEGGEVVVQTSLPEEPAIRLAAAHDYEAFAAGELEDRRARGHPPWARLLRVVVRAADARAAHDRATEVVRALEAAAVPGARWMGPATPPVARVAGRHRRQVLVQAPDARGVARALAAVRAMPRGRKGVDEQWDVDPVDLG
jgi:primosomal protein N' (replication factor Y)